MRKSIVIGLTGSIGMGKTTLASQFRALGAKVCHADAIVHALFREHGEAVPQIAEHFPEAVENGQINRKRLGDIVFHNKEKRQLLESILHPLVVARENAFIAHQLRKGARFIVLDIPLLYETGAQARCDLVVVATAHRFQQQARVLRRAHMTEEKFKKILSLQMPDLEKRKRADSVIQTGLGKAASFRQIKLLLERLTHA